MLLIEFKIDVDHRTVVCNNNIGMCFIVENIIITQKYNSSFKKTDQRGTWQHEETAMWNDPLCLVNISEVMFCKQQERGTAFLHD